MELQASLCQRFGALHFLRAAVHPRPTTLTAMDFRAMAATSLVAVVMLEVATASLACSGFQYMCRSLTWHASSAPVAPGMGIRGCRPGNCKRPCRSPNGPSSRILRLKLLFPMNHTNLFAWRSCKLQDSISQTCQASTSSLACIPRTPCHHLLSPSAFSCEVTLKKTLTFQGTSDFLRPGSGFLVTSLESSR